jgi:hypothetical protein
VALKVRQFDLEKDESGQAFVEYILLIAILVGFFLTATKWITQKGIQKKFVEAIMRPYVSAYRYGHTQAKGYDDGGPTFHPRIETGENNFRIFLNPDSKD